jgi:4-amino-4-deoxy-L-arabinose transferase-like glycosyltransferase
MIQIVSHDSAPPLFYLAERGVVVVANALGLGSFGGPGGPVALRLIPVLAGIAVIPLLAALGRRVGGDAAGLWTAGFVALVPTAVMLSEFARMYSPAATLTVASALLLWRAIEKPGPARWAAYVGAAAAAVWIDYFAAIGLAGILLAVVWLRPGWRAAAVALACTAVAVASLAPWLLAARAQFEHTGNGFWVLPLGPTMIGGTAAQLFIGPPVDGRVPAGTALIGLQDLAVVAGFVALGAGLFAWRRLERDGRRAAGFCLLASSGVVALAVISIWRPILDARYASVMWLPLFAVAGAGLAAMPRRFAGVLLAAVAVPALALSVATTHVDASALVPELDASIGANDVALTGWSDYLILLDELDPAAAARLHVLSAVDPPWYVGTAAYPPGAVVRAVPAEVAATHGRIFWIAEPDATPPALPAGYRALESRCATQVCLTVYGPGAGQITYGP